MEVPQKLSRKLPDVKFTFKRKKIVLIFLVIVLTSLYVCKKQVESLQNKWARQLERGMYLWSIFLFKGLIFRQDIM